MSCDHSPVPRPPVTVPSFHRGPGSPDKQVDGVKSLEGQRTVSRATVHSLIVIWCSAVSLERPVSTDERSCCQEEKIDHLGLDTDLLLYLLLLLLSCSSALLVVRVFGGGEANTISFNTIIIQIE